MSRHVKNEPIRNWQAGDVVQGFALLSRKEVRQDRNQRTYYDLELTDASGTMAAKVWADSPALTTHYDAHDFVAFKGSVKLYRDQLQISIDSCRTAGDDDRQYGFDEAKLIPSTLEDIDALYERLQTLMLESVEHPELRELARVAFEDHGDALKVHPAAKGIHHAYLGGLLEHTTSMAELAIPVCDHYPDVSRDLVLLGVLFHDLGKTRELGAMPANDYTREGRLVGHVVIGRDLLRDCAARVENFPPDMLLELEHLVLSHQGKREFASPVEPMTSEAFVLHALDDLDSKLNQLQGIRMKGTDEGEMVYVRALGRYVYMRQEEEEPEAPSEDQIRELQERFGRESRGLFDD